MSTIGSKNVNHNIYEITLSILILEDEYICGSTARSVNLNILRFCFKAFVTSVRLHSMLKQDFEQISSHASGL